MRGLRSVRRFVPRQPPVGMGTIKNVFPRKNKSPMLNSNAKSHSLDATEISAPKTFVHRNLRDTMVMKEAGMSQEFIEALREARSDM